MKNIKKIINQKKNEFKELKEKFKEYEIEELYSGKEKNNDELYSLKEGSNSKSKNNNSNNNNNFIINKIFTRSKSIDNIFYNTINSQRKMKRHNSIPRLKNHNNSYFLEKRDTLIEISNEKLDYQNITKELNKSLLKYQRIKRHNSICQNYLQLFFKKRRENKNDNMYDKYRKRRKFIKRKSKRDINFKQFLKREKEEEKKEKERKKENANLNKIKYEDDKENDWEIRFNMFKQYIAKLKKMSNEEFREDTLKFIKKDKI